VKGEVNFDEWRIVIGRWLKFNAVGVIGIGVQLGTLAILAGGFHLNYLVATGLAVEAAVLHNFIWHECWTWYDRTGENPKNVVARFVRFNLTTGALSIVNNLVLMRLLVAQAHLHYLLANSLTITACSFINFLVSDRLVFRPFRRSNTG
jgi:putative flippase GtrA